MERREDWDWEVGERTVCDVNQWREEFDEIQEYTVSPDGERIAAIVAGDEAFFPCINGTPWTNTYEKAWSLQFGPAGKLLCIGMNDDEWTVIVDDEPWEETYDYVWNLTVNPDGSVIAANIRTPEGYGISVNGASWENRFTESRSCRISLDGKHSAGTVQTKPLAEADTFGFLKGLWTVAVDGTAWENRFLNAWNHSFSDDGTSLAAEVRPDPNYQTIAVDGKPWERMFKAVWEPAFRPGSNADVCAPCLTSKGWQMFLNGNPYWDEGFFQLWHQRFSADGKHLAAVCASAFGRWTVAVDGIAWNTTFSHAVMPPVFSPDGKRVAAAFRDEGEWGVVVDGKPWAVRFNRVWDPVFSPNGRLTAVKGERQGSFGIFVNERPFPDAFEHVWDPVFSADGERILIRGIQSGAYTRKVVPVKEITG